MCINPARGTCKPITTKGSFTDEPYTFGCFIHGRFDRSIYDPDGRLGSG